MTTDLTDDPNELDHVPVHNDITAAPTRQRVRSFEEASGWKVLDRYPRNWCIVHWLSHRPCRFNTTGCEHRDRLPDPSALDHLRCALTVNGDRVLLASPYWFDRDRADELTQWCDEHGFDWCVNGFSHYWPGRTVSLVVGLRAEPPWPDLMEDNRLGRLRGRTAGKP